jgi:hypothetical protein
MSEVSSAGRTASPFRLSICMLEQVRSGERLHAHSVGGGFCLQKIFRNVGRILRLTLWKTRTRERMIAVAGPPEVPYARKPEHYVHPGARLRRRPRCAGRAVAARL